MHACIEDLVLSSQFSHLHHRACVHAYSCSCVCVCVCVFVCVCVCEGLLRLFVSVYCIANYQMYARWSQGCTSMNTVTMCMLCTSLCKRQCVANGVRMVVQRIKSSVHRFTSKSPSGGICAWCGPGRVRISANISAGGGLHRPA